MEYLEIQRKHSYMKFRFAGNGFAPATRYCDLDAALACSVIYEKCNLQCPKLQKHMRIYWNVQNVLFFNTSPKISHNFQGINHYDVKLWEFCCSSIIHYWHQANLATGRRKQFEREIKMVEW